MDRSTLTISLEDHLVECLEALPALLPTNLSAQLTQTLDSAESTRQAGATLTISYNLLSSISNWSRSEAGRASLSAQDPPLDVHAYDMIALLAGTRTSPDRKYPLYVPESEEREEERKRAVSDRKVITTLVNSLLSVGGAGFAAWYAAGQVHWRDEWRALLGLAVAIIVAIAEGVLYVIWDSNRSAAAMQRRGPRLASAVTRHKKHENQPPMEEQRDDVARDDNVRKRRVHDTSHSET